MEFELDKIVAVLERTPRVVTTLLEGLPRDWTHADYGPNTWSPHEIVGHLIFGDQTDWMPRARIILEKGASVPFEPFDRNGHAAICGRMKLSELLGLFTELRYSNLAALRSLSLTDKDLKKRGTHPALGPVTLSQLLAAWVVHDLNHIAQICKAMAYQQKNEVGPWEKYLSILAPPAPR